MALYQGTTPTLEFRTKADLMEFTLVITLYQYSCNLLNIENVRITKERVTENGEDKTKLTVMLTQKETLSFDSEVSIKIQVKAYRDANNVMASSIIETTINEILDKRLVGDS